MLWACTNSCLQSFETIWIFFCMFGKVTRMTALIPSDALFNTPWCRSSQEYTLRAETKCREEPWCEMANVNIRAKQQCAGHNNCHSCHSITKTIEGFCYFLLPGEQSSTCTAGKAYPPWRSFLARHASCIPPQRTSLPPQQLGLGGASHGQSSIAFWVCFPVSHWPHSKELVIRSLKSFPTNCMTKFLKHCCPFLIPFCQHPFQEKLLHAMVPDLYFILETGSKGIKVGD